MSSHVTWLRILAGYLQSAVEELSSEQPGNSSSKRRERDLNLGPHKLLIEIKLMSKEIISDHLFLKVSYFLFLRAINVSVRSHSRNLIYLSIFFFGSSETKHLL